MNRTELSGNIAISIISLIIFFSVGEIITRLIAGNPIITESDDVLFWKCKKGQSGRWKARSPVAHVDRNGFRQSGTGFDNSLPSIYTGGDSYAWGEGVLDSETFSSQLQSALSRHGLKYNVINGGVPGYGIGQIIDRMEAECEKYNPRYAIFLWVEDDINRMRDISPEQKKRFLRSYKLRFMFRYSAFLKLVIKERVLDKLFQNTARLDFTVDRNNRYKQAHAFNEKIKGLEPKIKSNLEFLRKSNITPIWVFMTVPSQEFRGYLTGLSKEYSVPLIDPETVYRAHFPGLKDMETRYCGHFKPEVYKILSDQVFPLIISIEQ